jgi:hypothetical protein
MVAFDRHVRSTSDTLHFVDFVTERIELQAAHKIEVYATNRFEMLTYCRARA